MLTATLLALVGRDTRSVVDVRVPFDRIGVPRREPSPGFRTGQPVVVRSFALAAPSKQPPKHRFSSSPFFPLRSRSSLVTTSDDRYGSSCIDTPAIGTFFRPERSHANRTLPFPGFGVTMVRPRSSGIPWSPPAEGGHTGRSAVGQQPERDADEDHDDPEYRRDRRNRYEQEDDTGEDHEAGRSDHVNTSKRSWLCVLPASPALSTGTRPIGPF